MSNFNPSFSKIGDILVHQKIISTEQLEQALSEQKNNNDKLGNILISQGVITEDDLVNAFSMQCGHRAITKEEMLKVDQSIVSLFAPSTGLPTCSCQGIGHVSVRGLCRRDVRLLYL